MPALKTSVGEIESEVPIPWTMPPYRLQVEDVTRYYENGYHPIEIYKTLNDRYNIVYKLDHDTCSITWLAVDKQTGRYVTVKVGTADSTACDETWLRRLKLPDFFDTNIITSAIPSCRDEYVIKGPPFLAKRSEVPKRSKKSASAQKSAQAEKPAKPKKPHDPKESKERMKTASDVWGLAFALWDLVARFPLFSGYASVSESIIVEHFTVQGPVHRTWWPNQGRQTNLRRRRFDIKGKPVDPMEYPDLEARFEQVAQVNRRYWGMETMGGEEIESFPSMLRLMLVFRPKKQATAKEVLDSTWMTRWSLPSHQKYMDVVNEIRVGIREDWDSEDAEDWSDAGWEDEMEDEMDMDGEEEDSDETEDSEDYEDSKDGSEDDSDSDSDSEKSDSSSDSEDSDGSDDS